MNEIKKIKPGVTELYIHSAINNEELRAVTASARDRQSDTDIFCDPDVTNMIRNEKIVLLDFLPLKKFQRDKMKWNNSFRSSQVIQLYRRMLGLDK
jgi:hypothetical protein